MELVWFNLLFVCIGLLVSGLCFTQFTDLIACIYVVLDYFGLV